MVAVLNKVEDQWWWVLCLRNGRRGFFPGNHLSMIDCRDDVEDLLESNGPVEGETKPHLTYDFGSVCVCVCVCHNEKSARRMASTTSDTGDTSSKQQQAQRKENYN